MLRKGNNELLIQKRDIKVTVRSVLLLTCLTVMIILFSKVYEQSEEIDQLRAQVEDAQTQTTAYENALTAQNGLINDLAATIQGQDDYIVELSDTNKSYVDELNELRSRAELYDRYEYVLTNSYGRTDLTYKEVQLGQDLMEAKGYDPELLFGTIYNESKGLSSAKNPNSTAAGYGQFLSATGKWIYEDYLQLGDDYDHSVTPYDGETNIKMMVGYYDYLYKETGGDITSVVASYSGGGREYAQAYLNKIERTVNVTGSSVYDGK